MTAGRSLKYWEQSPNKPDGHIGFHGMLPLRLGFQAKTWLTILRLLLTPIPITYSQVEQGASGYKPYNILFSFLQNLFRRFIYCKTKGKASGGRTCALWEDNLHPRQEHQNAICRSP
jgi:hypothetical protein